MSPRWPTQTGTSTSVNSKQQLFYNEVTLANDLLVDNHSMLFYHMKYSRPHLCFQPINISQRCHRLMIILIISGDISLNPGPVKNPCGLCHRPVAKNHRAIYMIYCESCYCWWHIKCANITPTDYKMWGNTDDPWVCPECNSFYFSDSFFNNSYEINSNEENSFSSLSSSLIYQNDTSISQWWITKWKWCIWPTQRT